MYVYTASQREIEVILTLMYSSGIKSTFPIDDVHKDMKYRRVIDDSSIL